MKFTHLDSWKGEKQTHGARPIQPEVGKSKRYI